MLNEGDPLLRPDYISYTQYTARELPVPKFPKVGQEVKGGIVKLVRSIAWSCDGKRIATGTEVKGLRIWETREKVDSGSSFPLPSGGDKTTPHNGHVAALAFSPVDPNILVSGCKASSGGACVAVWDIAAPKSPIATFSVPGDVLHIAFHPSGEQFAVVRPGTRDEVYFYWRIHHDGKIAWARREDVGLGGYLVDIGSEEINSLRFSNSGNLVCAVSNDGSLNAWLYPTGLRATSPDVPSALRVETANITAPSSPSAIDEAAEGGKSRAVTPREGTPVEDEGAEKPNEEVKAENAEEGERGTGRDVGRDVGEWTSAEGETGVAGASEENGPEDDVPMAESGGTAPTAETAAGTSATGAPAAPAAPAAPPMVELDTDADVEMTAASEQAVPAAAFTAPSRRASPPSTSHATPAAPTASLIPTGPSAETRLAAKEAEARRRQLKRFRHTICHSASLLSLSFDPTGRYLAVGGQDALLSLMDTRDWICVRTFDVCLGAIRHTAFSSDGELLAMGGDDNFIAIVSVHAGITIAKMPIIGALQALCWHPARNWLAYSTSQKVVVVWYTVQQE